MNYTNYQYEEHTEPRDAEEVIADYRDRMADWDQSDDARRTGLLNDLHEGLLNSDASEEQLAAAQFAANELSKSRNDPTYDHHAAGALQYLGILEPAPRDHLPQKANLDSHLTVWGETVGDGRQTGDQSDYGRDQQTDYADERQAISYLINQACTDARMATLRDMMHPQREPGVVDHQNMAEMAHDLKTVVAVVQADMDEHNILSDSSRQQMDYYRRMLTDVEQAHKRGEFERMRRNEAILLQGMIIHFDAACGDGNLDDRRSKTVNEVYQEVIDTKRQAADVEIAMGYRQPDEAQYRPNINVNHFGNDLIQKLEEQARYLRGDGVAGGTNYSELRDGINDAREAILDAIDSDGREMNSKKAAAFVLAIQALAENNPAYEQRMIRDLQQKLEAYLAGYRMADGAVIKDTVLDQHAMDVLDTINWPGAAYDRETHLKSVEFFENLIDELSEQKDVMEKTGSLSLETRTQYDRLSKMLANMRNNHIKEAEEYEESISTDPSYARRRSGERKMQEQQTIQDTLAALSHLPQYEEALTYVRQNASQSAQANFDSMVQDFLDTDDAAAAYRPSNWLQEPQNFEAIQNAMDQLNDLFHQDTQATICEHCKQSTEENMQHMAQLIANQGTSEIEQYVSDIAEGNAMAYPLRPDPSEILDEDEINAYNQRTAQAAQELMNDIREAGENTVELLTDQTNEDYAPELIQMSRRFEDLERRAQEINRTAQFT